MSKSLARVTAALAAAGIDSRPVEMPGETRTAQQAADAAGCALDQIVKSILFRGDSGQLHRPRLGPGRGGSGPRRCR